MRMRSVAASSALALILSAPASFGGDQYTITAIPPESPNGVFFQPTDINDSGTVVGFDGGLYYAPSLIWQGGKTRAIPTGQTRDYSLPSIGNNGTIVSSFTDEQQSFHSFSYDGNQITLLPETFLPNAINNLGVVAGNTGANAAIWTGGQVTVLNTPPNQASQAFAINDAGTVAGVAASYSHPGDFETVIWRANKMTYIGDLVGGFSYPRDINNSDTVVGTSLTSTAQERAFVWQAGKINELPTLPGDNTSQALAINNAGVIVGTSEQSGTINVKAVLWTGKTIVDLNSLLPPQSGWDLGEAYGINNLGQIVGIGSYKDQESAFLLNPPDLDALNAIPIDSIDPQISVPDPSASALLFCLTPLILLTRPRRALHA